MDGFQLHPRLAADCHVLGHKDGGWLLLQRNALLPWYILVPETGHGQLHELPPDQRARVRAQLDALAAFVQTHHGCRRVNLAAIGNLVPQLHIHVVGRREDDPCWPGVVWGRLPAGPDWGPAALEGIRQALRAAGLLSAEPESRP
ncbi:HIT domain-containing protein [Alkalilimnicola sp. S0819]|uniref:HIT domain-containing protein n=1 Tax=Alkalilimnicola sp. S0819 TaxID=2613922 RepID=UPI001261F132|nr:HIT family protein [Alkalilimnicola sp. S0819]KAB7623899.1 HIT domain-containing protein [Alkalilimnicola sp. S0819]MPQ16494.1 HIT domain-containing protein [Alkalilimnicola sp. S0819]